MKTFHNTIYFIHTKAPDGLFFIYVTTKRNKWLRKKERKKERKNTKKTKKEWKKERKKPKLMNAVTKACDMYQHQNFTTI